MSGMERSNSKLNLRPMEELYRIGPHGPVVVALRLEANFGDSDVPTELTVFPKGNLVKPCLGFLGWCMLEDLELPTEPIPSPPREPKTGEVWETSSGRRWIRAWANGQQSMISHDNRMSIDYWMSEYAADAKCVLEAPEVESE